MPVQIRLYHRVTAQSSVTNNAGPSQGHGTIPSLFCTGLRLTGNPPMRRPGEPYSLTISPLTVQRIEVSHAMATWSRGQESAM